MNIRYIPFAHLIAAHYHLMIFDHPKYCECSNKRNRQIGVSRNSSDTVHYHHSKTVNGQHNFMWHKRSGQTFAQEDRLPIHGILFCSSPNSLILWGFEAESFGKNNQNHKSEGACRIKINSQSSYPYPATALLFYKCGISYCLQIQA